MRVQLLAIGLATACSKDPVPSDARDASADVASDIDAASDTQVDVTVALDSHVSPTDTLPSDISPSDIFDGVVAPDTSVGPECRFDGECPGGGDASCFTPRCLDGACVAVRRPGRCTVVRDGDGQCLNGYCLVSFVFGQPPTAGRSLVVPAAAECRCRHSFR